MNNGLHPSSHSSTLILLSLKCINVCRSWNLFLLIIEGKSVRVSQNPLKYSGCDGFEHIPIVIFVASIADISSDVVSVHL